MKQSLLFTGITIASAQVVAAATLAEYDFSNTSNRGQASIAGSGVTANDFLFFGSIAGANGFSSANDGSIYYRSEQDEVDVMGNDEAGALASDYYFSFTVEVADTDDFLNLNQLTFDFGGSNALTSSFTENVLIYSDISEETQGNALFSESQVIPAETSADPTLNSGNIVDLSAAEFQGIKSITFYVRAYSDANDNGQIFRADNFVLDGEVSSIPEPSVYALALGVVGLGLVGLRRRRCR